MPALLVGGTDGDLRTHAATGDHRGYAHPVAELERLRHLPPWPYTISSQTEQAMVRRLTGTQYSYPTTRPFINQKRLKERRAKWGKPPDDEDGDSTDYPASSAPPPANGSSGSNVPYSL